MVFVLDMYYTEFILTKGTGKETPQMHLIVSVLGKIGDYIQRFKKISYNINLKIGTYNFK